MREDEVEQDYGYETIKINGIVTDRKIRKVGEISGSKGVIRSPIQWLIDIMDRKRYIEIKRVTEPNGKTYIIIDRLPEEEK